MNEKGEIHLRMHITYKQFKVNREKWEKEIHELTVLN